MTRFRVRFGLAAALLTLTSAATADQVPVVPHQADIVLDIETHTVTVTDRIVLPAGLTELRLGPDLVLKGPAWDSAED